MIGKVAAESRLPGADEAPSELRIGLIALIMLAAFAIFVVRLFQLQIVEGADLASRSERNSIRTLRLEAPRGDIVDREGRLLATTRPAFRVRVIPSEVRSSERAYRVLGELLDRDGDELAEKVGVPVGRRRFQPVALETDLSYLQLARVESHRYALPGVVTDMTPRRHYEGERTAAHLLGTIGEIDAEELARDAVPSYRAGDVVGKSGLEHRHEAHLRGKLGGRNIVVDVAGQEIEVIDEVDPVPGGRIVLTIDLDLQRVAEEAFRAEEFSLRGALVAIDPRNGEVLAMVSEPAYDPNLFPGGVGSETWNDLVSDESRPLRNRAISGQYPPGSTYKAVVAVAGIAEGILDPEEKVFCPGEYRLGRRTYRCWKRGGHGEVNLDQAVLGSCDVYFYKLGVELGVDKIGEYARKFGFGSPTGIDFQGEMPGLVPSREWKERARGERWLKGETVSASIGQGFNLATPIQLAQAFATFANGGTVYRPHVIKSIESWDGSAKRYPERSASLSAGIDPDVIRRVRQSLIATVQDPDGTGARARVEGVLVAGKTGTSQVVGLEQIKGLEDEDIPIRYRDHALFVGFAPAEAPEIALAVVVEHAGKGGGAAAAPIAQKVLAKYFEKHPVEGSPVLTASRRGGIDTGHGAETIAPGEAAP
ncbi:MAG TPA: penicillin-binding protein 2 [Myxococcales bacterium]|nr:penicillin-binding protein 2 [Myxococcales bacterium]HIL00711.1 penicillin-binding protein 2 [Myxococcales bacterium]